ncbi:MAG: DNA-protecting protein DprA [Alphaproteobacteria bacterium]|nr:DNA-protecting protein DprA [Alphaproteobacteria bacterium]
MVRELLSDKEKLARLRLSRTESIGDSVFWKLISAYGSAEEAIDRWRHSARKYEIRGEDAVFHEIDLIHKFGADFVFFEDEDYPKLLKQVSNPPPVLTFLGDRRKLSEFNKKNIVALIGARNSSVPANRFCEKLADDLGHNDVIIASGLAKGIDTYAHLGSIQTGTIAVLASGINVIYPKENAKLYAQIRENGIIFAEMPFDTSPQAHLFPKRNRIIAGVSVGVAVVEAAKQSGSLITARYALEYNREVFAVPGFPSDVRSEGGNALIKEGAIMVTSGDDILEHLFVREEKQKEINFLNESTERDLDESSDNVKSRLLNSLSTTAITVDELVSYVKLPPQQVLTVLMELELENRIERLPGQRVVLTPKM